MGEKVAEQLSHDAFRLIRFPCDGFVPVHVPKQKILQRAVLFAHCVGERNDGMIELPYLGGGARRGRGESSPRFLERILDHGADETADRLMDQAPRFERRIAAAQAFDGRRDMRHGIEIVERKNARAQAVVEIVIVVGDVVREGGDLRFGAGEGIELEIVQRVVFRGARRDLASAGVGAAQGAIVFDDSFERLPAEIQTVELGIAVFEPRQYTQGLVVVIEAAEWRHDLVESRLAGVAEWRVADIVSKGKRFGKILVEPKAARQTASDLRDLETVGETSPVMIAVRRDEHLGLVLEPAESQGVNDPVAITLEWRAGFAGRLRMQPAATLFVPRGIGCAPCVHGASIGSKTRNATGSIPAPAASGGSLGKRCELTFAMTGICKTHAGKFSQKRSRHRRMTETFVENGNISEPAVRLSDAAVRRLSELIAAENKPGLMLRVTVSGGGCSGFTYGFSFDQETHDDDRVFERDGVRVVIDETSLELLAGSEIDYVEEMVGSSFQIHNPNATASCGCGSSFSI